MGDPADERAVADVPGQSAQRRLPRTNSAAFDVLRKLPGVTPKNMYSLARRAGSLAGLATMTLEVLCEVLGTSDAKQLHDFLHTPSSQDVAEESVRSDVGPAEAAATVNSGAATGKDVQNAALDITPSVEQSEC